MLIVSPDAKTFTPRSNETKIRIYGEYGSLDNPPSIMFNDDKILSFNTDTLIIDNDLKEVIVSDPDIIKAMHVAIMRLFISQYESDDTLLLIPKNIKISYYNGNNKMLIDFVGNILGDWGMSQC